MMQTGRVPSAAPSKNSKLELISLGFVLLVQLLVCVSVRKTGFLAISDDDYARVVIANEFVSAPSWDPSGTSWLPFPFLLTGSVMTWLGPGLATARLVAVFSALAGTSLLYVGARCVGTPRLWSIAGSVVALSLPYAAYLSVATVPEYLTACLIVFAACTAGGSLKQRVGAGFALLLACASRYEAWPVAGVFALLSLLDASRCPSGNERKLALLPGALALVFPFQWLVHGITQHENALFFVARVVDYKNALGGATSSPVELLAESLRNLLLAEPVAIGLCSGSLTLLLVLRQDSKQSSTWLPRAWFMLGVMLLTLIIGAVRGGAPTHHSERALLSCWLFAALSSGIYLAQLPSSKKTRTVPTMLFALSAGLLLQAGDFFQREGFAGRGGEERIGRWLKSNPLSHSRIALSTPDYGYFAIMAAHGTPGDFEVLASHDPRAREAQGEDNVSKWMQQGGCRAVAPKNLVIPRSSRLFSTDSLTVWQSQDCGKLAPKPQGD